MFKIIYIPKTGGTVIENQIKQQYQETLFCTNHNTLLDFLYNKNTLQHQFYTTIYLFRNKLNINFDNIQIFLLLGIHIIEL